MTVNYILEEDLLKHLPFATGAVNLTTLMSPWSVGLAEAYAKKFPDIYKKYTEDQDNYKLRLSEPWVETDEKSGKTLYCLPIKTLAKDWGDQEVTAKALENLSKSLSGHLDIIMPITIIGDLSDSMQFLKKHLGNSEDIHFWVGISEKRALENKFKRDKIRVFLTGLKELPKDKIYGKLEEVLAGRNLKLEDIDVITMKHNKDYWPNKTKDGKPINHIVYPSDVKMLPRIIHFSDFGLAFLGEDDTDIKFNGFVQNLRKEKLDVEYVRV